MRLKNNSLVPGILIGGASFLLLTTPFWAMRLHNSLGLRWFTSTTAFVLLGIGGLLILLSCFILKDVIAKDMRVCFSPRHDFYGLLAALGLTFLVLIAVNQFILHQFLGSADEHSCYFLAECLRKGKLWVSPHPLSEFFNVVHVGNKAGKWFSVYPPGWPSLYAVGLNLRVADFLNPLLATLALFVFYHCAKLLYSHKTACLALLTVVMSPFFLFTSAAYFSHPTCFLMMCLFSYGFLKWHGYGPSTGKSSNAVWALLCGFTLAYGLITRYLTMACFALPFLVYHFWPVVTRKRRLDQNDCIFLACGITALGVIFYQNFVITGKITMAPNRFDKRWERLGFRSDYTILDGLNFIVARFFYLMDWAPPMAVVIYLIGMFSKQKRAPIHQIFRLSFWSSVLGYLFYYSWGGNQFGPRYYYEVYPFLALEFAAIIRSWWGINHVLLKNATLGILIANLLSSAYLFYKQERFFNPAFMERKALYDLAKKTIPKDSIVFIRGFLGHKLVLGEEDAVRNSPFLDGTILYAHDLKDQNQKLMDYYPDREYYLGAYDREQNIPVLTKIH